MSEPIGRLRSFLMGGCYARPGDLRDAFDDLAALEVRIEALERVRQAAEIINAATHEANKGVYQGKTCPHGNLPIYPTHGRWCDECWQELEDALAALAAEETPTNQEDEDDRRNRTTPKRLHYAGAGQQGSCYDSAQVGIGGTEAGSPHRGARATTENLSSAYGGMPRA